MLASQQTILRQFLQITPHRHLGNAEMFGKLSRAQHLALSGLFDQPNDMTLTLIFVHNDLYV